MNKGPQVELLYQEKLGDAPQWFTASLLLLECRKSVSPFNFQHENSFAPHCKVKGHSIRESFAQFFKIQLQSQPEPSRWWQSCYINSHAWHFQPFSSLRECIPGHNTLRQPTFPSITIWQLGLRYTRPSVWVPMQPAHPLEARLHSKQSQSQLWGGESCDLPFKRLSVIKQGGHRAEIQI